MECRICYGEEGTFVNPCKCKGDTNVHEKCLIKWIETSGRNSKESDWLLKSFEEFGFTGNKKINSGHDTIFFKP